MEVRASKDQCGGRITRENVSLYLLQVLELCIHFKDWSTVYDSASYSKVLITMMVHDGYIHKITVLDSYVSQELCMLKASKD